MATTNKPAPSQRPRTTGGGKAPATPITRGERLAAKAAAAKAQAARKRNGGLNSTAITVIVSAVVVVAFFVIFLVANSGGGNAGNTPGGAVGTFDPNAKALAVGAPAPALPSFKGADGANANLSDYKGKAVLLELFAPWCPHCQAETATLNKLQADLGSKGVQVVSISASPYGRNYESGDSTPISFDDIKWFHDNFHLIYPALYDPALKTANTYGLNGGYPTFYVINTKNTITYTGSGEVTYDQLAQELTKALSS
jgi:peroxiredoxin